MMKGGAQGSFLGKAGLYKGLARQKKSPMDICIVREDNRMEPKNIEGLELELEIKIEELEHKIAPGELVWPFTGSGGWGGR